MSERVKSVLFWTILVAVGFVYCVVTALVIVPFSLIALALERFDCPREKANDRPIHTE